MTKTTAVLSSLVSHAQTSHDSGWNGRWKPSSGDGFISRYLPSSKHPSVCMIHPSRQRSSSQNHYVSVLSNLISGQKRGAQGYSQLNIGATRTAPLELVYPAQVAEQNEPLSPPLSESVTGTSASPSFSESSSSSTTWSSVYVTWTPNIFACCFQFIASVVRLLVLFLWAVRGELRLFIIQHLRRTCNLVLEDLSDFVWSPEKINNTG